MIPEAIVLLCLGCFAAGLWASTLLVRHASGK